MNWYSKILLKQASGEWWIMDGQALYADSDIGDMGHEAYVVDYARRELSGEDIESEGDWDQWQYGVMRQYLEPKMQEAGSMMNHEEDDVLRSQYSDQFDEYKQMMNDPSYASSFLIENAQELGIDQELLSVAQWQGDAREYGMRVLGWIRVENNHVETWTLTDNDCMSMARGLGEIAEQSGYEDDEDMEYHINVLSTKKWYNDVHIDCIEKGVSCVTQKDEQTQTQKAYDAALNQVDRPSNSFYKGWGD